jgi:hypothetical protein
VTDISYEVVASVKAANVVICDVSEKCPATYYAAGMARAQGKFGILTCKAKKRGEIPFAGEQMGLLVWETAAELSNNLTHTIQSLKE